ncbi:hypothetical protein GCM10009636_32160 [Arthrobacter koreensis]|uniref:hypothetical protein n=1 Tax=Arthrobacter koreensis TaxID=199136 RepID=UPI001D015FDB|nr:hypothetical protein [Arthrobacter koreensis]
MIAASPRDSNSGRRSSTGRPGKEPWFILPAFLLNVGLPPLPRIAGRLRLFELTIIAVALVD